MDDSATSPDELIRGLDLGRRWGLTQTSGRAAAAGVNVTGPTDKLSQDRSELLTMLFLQHRNKSCLGRIDCCSCGRIEQVLAAADYMASDSIQEELESVFRSSVCSNLVLLLVYYTFVVRLFRRRFSNPNVVQVQLSNITSFYLRLSSLIFVWMWGAKITSIRREVVAKYRGGRERELAEKICDRFGLSYRPTGGWGGGCSSHQYGFLYFVLQHFGRCLNHTLSGLMGGPNASEDNNRRRARFPQDKFVQVNLRRRPHLHKKTRP